MVLVTIFGVTIPEFLVTVTFQFFYATSPPAAVVVLRFFRNAFVLPLLWCTCVS
ncbi:Copper-exporting P-type ATPase [Frankliniella fusca]|uniref:Copper-exporting P-type ATPase n=1 Tax=Frankliniella fusca TaxID=407009 RepID=A0AAE1L9W7_9NEOP|nr:Copper-exporting P-type ATPase [Frankliniella fusca]